MSNGRPWTADDTATLERMAGKYTDTEIAAKTGHAPITVRKQRTCRGLLAFHHARAARLGWSWDELPIPTLQAIRKLCT